MSPTLWRVYSNDIPACLSSGSIEWERGENEANSEVDNSPLSTDHSILMQSVLHKLPDDRNEDEEWDIHLLKKNNKPEMWKEEKTGIGPEPSIVPVLKECTASATIYADDNSAGEEGDTVEELKDKTEVM